MRFKGELITYSKKARDKILHVGKTVFSNEGISGLTDEVFQCVDELIKNAVKANYKFVLIIEKLSERLSFQNKSADDILINKKISEIIRNKELYDETAAEIADSENIIYQVREILNEESVLLKIKNRAYDENRDFSSEENDKIKKLSKLTRAKELLCKRNAKIILNVESGNGFIFIEVTNTAPIIGRDLKRIHAKRDEFKVYAQESREHEFFINNLDTSEAGFGLGYATIDSTLFGIGLDPYKTIQIVAASDTTVILSLPVSELKR